MSLAKSLPSQCASRAASALRGQRPLPQVCRNKRLDSVQTPGGNVVSLQGSMILASRGFSVIFPQGLTNSMASVAHEVRNEIGFDQAPNFWNQNSQEECILLWRDSRRKTRPAKGVKSDVAQKSDRIILAVFVLS